MASFEQEEKNFVVIIYNFSRDLPFPDYRWEWMHRICTAVLCSELYVEFPRNHLMLCRCCLI